MNLEYEIRTFHTFHALRGGSSNRAFHPMNGRIACGSMVHVLSCSQRNSLSEFLCEQDLASSALPEAEIPFGSGTA
jgi:hypothetical protein